MFGFLCKPLISGTLEEQKWEKVALTCQPSGSMLLPAPLLCRGMFYGAVLPYFMKCTKAALGVFTRAPITITGKPSLPGSACAWDLRLWGFVSRKGAMSSIKSSSLGIASMSLRVMLRSFLRGLSADGQAPQPAAPLYGEKECRALRPLKGRNVVCCWCCELRTDK